MQDSKLIITLKLLSKEDIKEIKRLILSELLVKGSYGRECEELFHFLISFYPTFDDISLNKDNVLKEIFKGSESKINRLEKTMTNLLQVVEYYIAHFVVNEGYDTLRNNLALAKFYREQELPQRSDSFLLKVENELKGKKLETEYFYWVHKYKEERVSVNQAKGEKLPIELHSALFNTSFEYSILLSIESFAKVTFLQRLLNENIFIDLNNIISRNEKLSSNPLIRLYLLILWVFNELKEDHFLTYLQEFDELFEAQFESIQYSSAYFLSAAKRICISIRHNYFFNHQSLTLLVNNYKKDLKTGYLLTNGYMHAATAINIVNNSLKLKENNWVHNFLEEYKDNIGFQYENRVEILKFCWAQYYFAEKKYEKAEEYCNVYYDNIFYLIATRRLQIKIYFERKEFIVLESELEALKVYLYRQYKQKKVISEDFFQINNAFVDTLKQIYSFSFNPNAAKKSKLIEKMEKGKCSDEDWLLEKINEIK